MNNINTPKYSTSLSHNCRRKKGQFLVHQHLNPYGKNGRNYSPAFTGNREAPIHRWVPWIAGYSASFVKDVFNNHYPKLNPDKSRVLDPFAGVGTTLVEAQMNGLESRGFEINPWAWLACKVKLNAHRTDPHEIQESLVAYTRFMTKKKTPRRTPPKGFRSRIPFFSTLVEEKILRTLDFIDEIEDSEVQDFFRVGLGSILVTVSNYSYEPSLGSRPAAGKPLVVDADVASILGHSIQMMLQDILQIAEEVTISSRGVIHLGNFLDYHTFEKWRRFDLAVTSPPYLNNYHYVRNTRPHLWWLDLITSSDSLDELETANIGKFWQKVRGYEEVLPLYSHPSLDQIAKRIRNTHIDAQKYGGEGWANYVVSYFNDLFLALRVLHKALTEEGTAVIVIGNSVIQGHPIPTDKILLDLGKSAGFADGFINRIRDKRVGSSIVGSRIRYGSSQKITLYESAVILRNV